MSYYVCHPQELGTCELRIGHVAKCILDVVFQVKNSRNRRVVYDVEISLCLLWIDSVILSALKRTLLLVTEYGGYLLLLHCYFFYLERPFKEAYLGMNTIIF